MHFDTKACQMCNGTGSRDSITYHTMGTADVNNKPDWACPACGGFGWIAKPVSDTYSMVEAEVRDEIGK